MKKFSLALVLLMIVSMLAGCAVVERVADIAGVLKDPASVLEGKVETFPAPDHAEVTEATESATEETEPATEAVEATEPATEAAEENTVSMGRLVGGVYSNSYTGYACELNTNWEFYSAEELQDMPQNVAEMMGDSELLDDETVLSQFTDMMAENVEELVTINVLYQKLSLDERLGYAMMGEKELLEAMLGERGAMEAAYANAGILVDNMETVTINFLGEERVAMHTEASIQGVPYYTLQLFDFDLGAYGVTLTLASFAEDNTMSLADLFYAVD